MVVNVGTLMNYFLNPEVTVEKAIVHWNSGTFAQKYFGDMSEDVSQSNKQ